MTKVVDVHIFSPGTQTSAQGVTREFTSNDLAQVADSYNSQIHEAPIRVGHEDNDKVPAWGWVKGVKLKGEDLYAEVEFSPQMGQYVRDGLYKKVSASFYAPESKINPEPGSWSLRHVAMLGAQPPAVKGLKGFAYEETKEGVLDFSSAVDISPDTVFDEDLGPSLDVDQSPLEFLKDQLEEARQEMAKEKEREASDDMELEAAGVTDEATEERPDSDFAEEDKAPMKKKPSKAKQGEEDVDEEEDGEDSVDNGELPPALKKAIEKKKGKSSDDDDTSDNKEKMDPVGKEDADVDADSSEEDTADHAGCDSKKKSYKEKKSDEDYSDEPKDEGKFEEMTVPEGVDAVQWEAGFKDAMDKFYAAAEAGADEVVHQEAEDQSADYLAGIEAGFEFGQARLNRIGSDGIGSATHDTKCCDEDEVADGQGPVASKVKKQKSGANETDGDQGKFAETTKKGKDGVKTTEKNEMAEDDESKHDEGFGREEGGKADASGVTDRNKTGKGKSADAIYDGKQTGKAPDQDREKTGKAPAEDRNKLGKAKDVQSTGGVEYKSTGGPSGSGKAIKSPSVRVMRFSEQQFSEMEERLNQLEAMNSKLVADKQAAERKAHRMQLNDFAESLYDSGRLTEGMIEQDELVDYMEGLENGTLEFSEGETAATKLMDILAALPQQVEFSEVAGHDPESVPNENLDPHERALRLVKDEGMEYAEALKQTLFTAE